ncbi:MAG: NUDIX domain-containing protein [Alphaproteobacteria bacterium]
MLALVSSDVMHESAVLLPYDAHGRVLLQFRDGLAPYAPLMFGPFGGGREPEDDTAYAIIRREIAEELAFDVENYSLQYFGFVDTPHLGIAYRRHVFTLHRPFTSPYRVLEGAGAAFLTKDDVYALVMKGVCSTFVPDLIGKLP